MNIWNADLDTLRTLKYFGFLAHFLLISLNNLFHSVQQTKIQVSQICLSSYVNQALLGLFLFYLLSGFLIFT